MLLKKIFKTVIIIYLIIWQYREKLDWGEDEGSDVLDQNQ